MEKLKKNIFGKMRKLDVPIANFISNYDHSWQVKVLKIYQLPHKHTDFSRWYTVAKSDNTFGRWEYGDQYAKDIMNNFEFFGGEKEFESYFINNNDFKYSSENQLKSLVQSFAKYA
jgi:hypothetical protein